MPKENNWKEQSQAALESEYQEIHKYSKAILQAYVSHKTAQLHSTEIRAYVQTENLFNKFFSSSP